MMSAAQKPCPPGPGKLAAARKRNWKRLRRSAAAGGWGLGRRGIGSERVTDTDTNRRTDLDDVVLEADAFLLLAGAVLDVEDADEVGGPAAHEAVEDLEQHAGEHAQLREGVGQRQ